MEVFWGDSCLQISPSLSGNRKFRMPVRDEFFRGGIHSSRAIITSPGESLSAHSAQTKKQSHQVQPSEPMSLLKLLIGSWMKSYLQGQLLIGDLGSSITKMTPSMTDSY